MIVATKQQTSPIHVSFLLRVNAHLHRKWVVEQYALKIRN
jgi:hypothetical protein